MPESEYIISADSGDPPELPPSVLPGQVIAGRYEIKRLLGTGGNGAVYEGMHATVGHRVAIKVIHRTLTEREEVLARFQREAKICGSLSHPHVGKVFDFGMLDDGAPFMVMELQEGRSLADIIDDTKLPFAAIIDITRQVLGGLAAVHRAGVIHRDMKPDNVMIVRDHDGDIVAKVVDFGISKPISTKHDTTSVTAEGTIIGSPDYMSPEQVRGVQLDQRTDLYSVGVMLYEALTGRLPFENENLMDLVLAIMSDDFTPPTKLRPDCPPALEQVVLKAMARKPEERYQSADEMSRALAEVRAATRNAPSTGLGALSERPPATQHVQRRRTIDSHTLERIRQKTSTLEMHTVERARARAKVATSRGRPRWQIVAAASAAVASVVIGWAATSEAPASVVVTALPPAPTALAAPAAVATHPAAPAVPTVVADKSAEPAPRPTPVDSTSSAQLAPLKPHVRVRAPRTVVEPVGAPAPVVRVEPAPVLDPATTQALFKQATTAFLTGQVAQARGLYQQIVKASPQHADAWRGLGLAASRLGQRAEAARAFQRYLDLRPTAPDAARIREQLDKVRQ